MNIELLKALGPYVGGALGIIGVLLNFALSRYAAARPEHRPAWHAAFGTLLLLILTVIASAALSVGQLKTAGVFFLMCFIVQIVQFLRNVGPVRRSEVVVFAFTCSTYFTLFGLVLVGWALSAITGVMTQMDGNMTDLAKTERAIVQEQTEIIHQQSRVGDLMKALAK